MLLAQLQEARLRSARLQTSLRTGAQVAVANKLLDNSAYVDRKVQSTFQLHHRLQLKSLHLAVRPEAVRHVL